MKKAFTLAEVLITLGVIGIVAALTMPALVSNYRKSVIETRLQKFYSVINQAAKLSQVDNGEQENWEPIPASAGDEIGDWYEKYLAPYLKTVKTEIRRATSTSSAVNGMLIYFPDGSAFEINTGSALFFPDAKAAAEITYATRGDFAGRRAFAFGPTARSFNQTYGEYATDEEIRDGYVSDVGYDYANDVCSTETTRKSFCTTVIQRNGWKIPADYPFSF